MSEAARGCEVAVIGAGPAGSAAAYHLAAAGVDVLLADQAAFPRDKVCGDLLGGQALVELPTLGIDPATHWGDLAEPVERWAVTSCEGTERGGTFDLGFGLDDRVVLVRRLDLDDALRRRALEAGARWLSPCRCVAVRRQPGGDMQVRAVGAGGEALSISARAVVCAWGSGPGAGGRPDGADGRVLVAGRRYYAGVDLAPDTAEMHYLDYLPINYLWVFPLSGGAANVGIVLPLAEVRRLGRRLDDHFHRALADVGRRRRSLRNALAASPFRAALLRTAFEPGVLAGDGLLLAGDAAGAADPLNGEGIGPALLSGRLAAETLVRALRRSGPVRRDDLEPYAAALTARFGPRYAGAVDIARRRAELVSLVAAS